MRTLVTADPTEVYMRCALTLATLLLATGLAAQSYTASSGALTSAYADIASPTATGLTTGMISTEIFPTGFSFNYFGTNYTSFQVASGGYMNLGGGSTVISKPPAHSSAPGRSLSPCWHFLAPGVSLVSATSPSMPPPGSVNWSFTGGTLSVEWKNVPTAANTAVGVCMKVLLNTANGEIEFQYGSVPTGTTGATNSYANCVAIASPVSASQEVIPGVMTGYIGSNGAITSYPAGRFVKFTPAATQPNNPPTLTVTQAAGTVTNGSTVNVNHGISLSTLIFGITANDADSDPVSIAASISNVGTTGILQSEWDSATAGVPYTLNPTTGVFNTAAGVTHSVTLTADDGTDVTTFAFDIVQAPAPTPGLSVSDGAAVSHGQGAAGTNRDFGSIDITAGPTGALTITISNTGAGNLAISGFNVAGDAAHFVLDTNGVASPVGSGGSTTFTVAFDPSTPGLKVAQVSFVHNDLTVTSPFSFEVTGAGTSVTPTPIVAVHEENAGGALIANGAAATGIRAFGSMDIALTPGAPITIFVLNAGNATLTLGAPFATNSDFTVNATGFPGSLAAGASATFTVSFTPATVGTKSANIEFTHNDASTTTPFAFQVTGTATTSGPGPGPGPGNTGGSGGGGGGGCTVAGNDYWMLVFLIAAGASLGARTLRRRVR